MSMLCNKALWAAVAMMLANSISADVYTLTAFPNKDCNDLGLYDSFSTAEDTNQCSAVSYSTEDFDKVNDKYQIWWELNDDIDTGCEVALLGIPSSGASRDCGECLGKISNPHGCLLIPVPDQFFVTWCCGGDCNDYCGAPAKRSLDGNWTEPVRVERKAIPEPVKVEREAIAETVKVERKAIVDPAKMKSQPLLEKRAKCSFKAKSKLFDKAGTPVQVTNTINSCPSEEGCMVQYSGTVEKSFSQTFGVETSVSASFFEIVSASVSFSYDETYEESSSTMVSGTFVVPQNEGGYVTFSPISQCITGSFSGDDCPEGVKIDEDGDACVPETINGGKTLKGDLNLVISG